MTIMETDLGKALSLTRQRESFGKLIALIERTDDFLVKDKASHLYSEFGDHQITVSAHYLREPLLQWARTELMLIEGALQGLGVELAPTPSPS